MKDPSLKKPIVFHLFVHNRQIYKKNRLVVTAGGIGGKLGVTANGYEISFQGNENSVKLIMVIRLHNPMNILKTIIHFKG